MEGGTISTYASLYNKTITLKNGTRFTIKMRKNIERRFYDHQYVSKSAEVIKNVSSMPNRKSTEFTHVPMAKDVYKRQVIIWITRISLSNNQ